MDFSLIIISIIVVTVIICCLFGWLWVSRYPVGMAKVLLASQTKSLEFSEQQRSELLSKCHHNEQQLLDLTQVIGRAKGRIDALQQQLLTASNERVEALAQVQSGQAELRKVAMNYASLEATLNEREVALAQQIETLQNSKQQQLKDFEQIASQVLEAKGRQLTDNTSTRITDLLKPFKQQIDGFQSRANEIHESSIKTQTSLSGEIKKVLDIGLQMSSEASNLTHALKGDSQQRGAWGEAQLQRTLEMSGLVEGDHYEAQKSFRDEQGKLKITDYLVKLPDQKHIIIDSKVSLVAYDRAIEAANSEMATVAMNNHVKAVKSHIDDLAAKDYSSIIGVRSPNFVLMFMPIEPAYIDALKTNKDLFSYGYERGVVLVSHTTLIPILRTVSNLWMLDQGNREARELSDSAGAIYNQVCVVAERLDKLGGSLNATKNHFNGAITSLVGQQGLYSKVERFSKLSHRVKKALPEIETSTASFEHDRLKPLIEVQPIED